MDKNLEPKISVLMPVYNCRRFIEDSVISILNQTFKDFEFIIIDDCSTDGTYEYLLTLTDPRIILIRKIANSGYTISLNMGIEMAKGMYIARMDGDDISLPDRFEKQITFMNKNPDVIVCGGGYKAIGSDFIFIPKASNDELLVELLSYSPLAHPTAFFRTKTLKDNKIKYTPHYEPAEDYKMWITLSEYGKLANLTDIILQYRIHPNQISNYKAQIQKEKTELIALEYVRQLSKNHEYFEFYCNTTLNSLEDLKKYEIVEEYIKLNLKEKKIYINNHLFLERKKNYLKNSLTRLEYSIPDIFRDFNLLIKCRSILGFNLIVKHLIKCLVYYKHTNMI
jgi:glycosyltransferase involved in cell wall biosynthesis